MTYGWELNGDEAVRAERLGLESETSSTSCARKPDSASTPTVMKGSRAIEALTRQMAEQAWARYEEMEAWGGRLALQPDAST